MRFEYDLFLQSEGPPISHVRYEKMTFKNPSEDFRMKLIKGGGVSLFVQIQFKCNFYPIMGL